MRKIKNIMQKGTSVIELIIYMALVLIVLVFVMNFTLDVIETSQKSRSRQEVQQNARFSLHRIITEIRSAKDLDALGSTFGVNPGVLSLVHRNPAFSTTVFDVSGNALRIKQGTNPAYNLTSSQVIVTDFTLQNLTVNNRTKIVRVTLTLSHVNPNNQNYFNATVTVRGSAVIRVKER